MQKSYDNLMQYLLTLSLSINVLGNVNLSFQIVKEEDHKYHRALKAGELCRMAEEWFNDGIDIKGWHMKAWLDSST